MAESYVAYVMKHTKRENISRFCKAYCRKTDFMNAAIAGFNGENDLLGNNYLFPALYNYLTEYIKKSELLPDAYKIYRVRLEYIERRVDVYKHVFIDKDELFDCLVDINWLLCSKYANGCNKQTAKIDLLVSEHDRRKYIVQFLNDVLYDGALFDEEQCTKIDEASKIGWRIVPGLHPDEKVREYISYFNNGQALPHEYKAQAVESSRQKMALFFALTATEIWADEMRRYL